MFCLSDVYITDAICNTWLQVRLENGDLFNVKDTLEFLESNLEIIPTSVRGPEYVAYLILFNMYNNNKLYDLNLFCRLYNA